MFNTLTLPERGTTSHVPKCPWLGKVGGVEMMTTD